MSNARDKAVVHAGKAESYLTKAEVTPAKVAASDALASLAQAHATLALFWQAEAAREPTKEKVEVRIDSPAPDDMSAVERAVQDALRKALGRGRA